MVRNKSPLKEAEVKERVSLYQSSFHIRFFSSQDVVCNPDELRVSLLPSPIP